MNPTRRSLLCAAALLLPLPALAGRVFPRGTVRGQITFVRDKEVFVNGAREKLSPGVRLHDAKNRIPPRGALDGQTFTVNYVRDPRGVIREVWLLTPQEAQRPMPMDASGALWQQQQQIHLKQIYRN
ncbi:MAG: hypothetical protein IKH84_04895 [Ottowia sp.]|nr:hypothetical protein [Ottowia sp.]